MEALIFIGGMVAAHILHIFLPTKKSTVAMLECKLAKLKGELEAEKIVMRSGTCYPMALSRLYGDIAETEHRLAKLSGSATSEGSV